MFEGMEKPIHGCRQIRSNNVIENFKELFPSFFLRFVEHQRIPNEIDVLLLGEFGQTHALHHSEKYDKESRIMEEYHESLDTGLPE